MAKRPETPAAAVAMAPSWHDFDLPSFSRQHFQIYPWQLPAPTDFTALSPDRRREKSKLDRDFKADDPHDGADDWHEFGDVQDFGDTRAYCYDVASNFANRAKRSFAFGNSWVKFAKHDAWLNDSSTMKLNQTDEVDGDLLIAPLPDDKLKLAIFEQIAQRLCTEVWLEQYPGPVEYEELFRRDSKQNNVAREMSALSQLAAPAQPQGQARNSRPVFGGDSNAGEVMGGRSRGVVGETRIGNVGLNGRIHGMTALEEIAGAPMDMETSDEDTQDKN